MLGRITFADRLILWGIPAALLCVMVLVGVLIWRLCTDVPQDQKCQRWHSELVGVVTVGSHQYPNYRQTCEAWGPK